MNGILRCFFVLSLLLTFGQSKAQVFWSEDFGMAGACTDIDTVRVISAGTDWDLKFPAGANALDTVNRWFISSREAYTGLGNCGNGCGSLSNLNQTLHISTNQGNIDPGAEFENDSATNIIAWSPEINAIGTDQAHISFDYLHGGGPGDIAAVVFSIGTGPKLGGTWSGVIDTLPKAIGSCGVTGEWTHFEAYIDDATANQTQLYIGFQFVSDGNGSGANPSIAIDNIVLTDTFPDVQFSVDNDTVCLGDAFNFTNETQSLNASYEWKFGPNNNIITTTNANPGPVTYTVPGTYVVTLTATNNVGSDSTFYTVEVLDCQPPTPNFIASDYNICAGQCINFFDNSIDGTFGTGQWNWQFQGGSPNLSIAENPQNICYANPGVYDVTMIVTDTVSGLSDTVVFADAITVGTCFVPTVTFEADTTEICNNDFVTFTAFPTGNPDDIRWIFQGGNPADTLDSFHLLETITVFYPTPGLYTVICIVSNGAGTGSDTLVDYINVLNCPTPDAQFETNRKIICPGEVVVFQDNSLYATEWYWEFPGGQPSTSTDQFPVEIKYETPGSYPVILIVKNVNGEDTLIAEEYITVDSCNGPEPRFSLEKDSICRGSCVQFFDLTKYVDITDSTDSIIWVFWWHPYPDTNIKGTAADTITASTPGYQWMLTALDSTFAEDTFLISRDYWPMMPPVVDELDPIFCFDDSGTVGVQLFGYNEHSVGVLNRQDEAVLSIGGKYPKIRTGEDIGENRTRMTDVTIRIDNPESRFYLEDTTRLPVTGTGPYWRWFPEVGLSCYDCRNPIVYPTETRKYYVTNFDDYGCQAYDSLVVYVEEAYYAGIPNIFSPNGDNNNDILWVRGNAIANDGFVMRIWNRYGEVVFESYSQNNGWNGNYKGAPAPSGSYKYYVKLTFENGTVEELTGNVSLVRY